MPLHSGPVVRAAQIPIWSFSSVFLPPVSTAMRTSAFVCVCVCVWQLSMAFYIFHRHSLPSWSRRFNLQLVQLVGRFWVFILCHSAPGFQLWFYFRLCMCVSSWGCRGGLGFAPVRARCGGGAAAWVTGVLAAPGTQGCWWLEKKGI